MDPSTIDETRLKAIFPTLARAEQEALATDMHLTDPLARIMAMWMHDEMLADRLDKQTYADFLVLLVGNPALSTAETTRIGAQALDALPRNLVDRSDMVAPGPLLESWGGNPALPFTELTGEIKKVESLPLLLDRAAITMWFLYPHLKGQMSLMTPSPDKWDRFWGMVETAYRAAEAAGLDVEYEIALAERRRLNRSHETPENEWRMLNTHLYNTFRNTYQPDKVALNASLLVWTSAMVVLYAPHAFRAKALAPSFWAFVQKHTSYEGPAWFWQVALEGGEIAP